MLPTDLDLAILQSDTYSAIPAGKVIDYGCDRVVITYLPDCTVLSIRGTDNPEGWISNFKAIGVLSSVHPQLGECESGFLSGALDLWSFIEPVLGTHPLIVQGHSRGAGMIPIIVSMMLLVGLKPAKVVCWESPWAVGPYCRKLLLDADIPGVQWWHGDDPVPCIPAVPWLCHAVWPIIHFGSWSLNPFECHGMSGIITTLMNTGA
jgi:hypothetical protein